MFSCFGSSKTTAIENLPTTYTPNIHFDGAFHEQFKPQYANIYNLLCLGRRLEAIPLAQAALKQTQSNFPLEYAWFLVLRCLLDFDSDILILPPEVATRRKDGFSTRASEIVRIAEYQYVSQNGPMVTRWNHWETQGTAAHDDGQRRAFLDLLSKVVDECPITNLKKAEGMVLNDLELLFHIMYLFYLMSEKYWVHNTPKAAAGQLPLKQQLSQQREKWRDHNQQFFTYATHSGRERLDLVQLLDSLLWGQTTPIAWNMACGTTVQYDLNRSGEGKARKLAKSQSQAAYGRLCKDAFHDRYGPTRAEYLDLAETFKDLGNPWAELHSRLLATKTSRRNRLTREEKLAEFSTLRQRSLTLGQPRLTLQVCNLEFYEITNKTSLYSAWKAMLPILRTLDQAETLRLGTLHTQKTSPTIIHRLLSDWNEALTTWPFYDRVFIALCAERFAVKYHQHIRHESEIIADNTLEAYLSAFNSPNLFRGESSDAIGVRLIADQAEKGLELAEAAVSAKLATDAQAFKYAAIFTRYKISQAVCPTNRAEKNAYLRRAGEVAEKYFSLAQAKENNNNEQNSSSFEFLELLLCIHTYSKFPCPPTINQTPLSLSPTPAFSITIKTNTYTYSRGY